MTTRGATGIVVGIEGTAASQGALEWAIREAAVRGCELTVVHAWDYVPARDAGRMSEHEERTASDCMLDAAVASAVRAVGVSPEVVVRSVRGSAAKVLLAESEFAQLLVLGARSPQWRHRCPSAFRDRRMRPSGGVPGGGHSQRPGGCARARCWVDFGTRISGRVAPGAECRQSTAAAANSKQARMSSVAELGIVLSTSGVDAPSAISPRMVATGIRVPRMHGTPPMMR